MPPPLIAIESMWAPMTITSLGLVVPVIVAMTERCSNASCANSSTVTSGRSAAWLAHWSRSHVGTARPPVVV
jgi:hypothetical protein